MCVKQQLLNKGSMNLKEKRAGEFEEKEGEGGHDVVVL